MAAMHSECRNSNPSDYSAVDDLPLREQPDEDEEEEDEEEDETNGTEDDDDDDDDDGIDDGYSERACVPLFTSMGEG